MIAIHEDTSFCEGIHGMFDAAGVNYHQYHRTQREITIRLEVW